MFGALLGGIVLAAAGCGGEDELLDEQASSAVAPGTGLSGAYFNNPSFSGNPVRRLDRAINFDWRGGSPAHGVGSDRFTVRWTGQIRPGYTERYTFHVVSDDGARLWVDGQQLIDAWCDQAATERLGSINLQGGRRYDIRLEYFENGGQASAKLLWSSPSVPKRVVPTGRLYPSSGGGSAVTPAPVPNNGGATTRPAHLPADYRLVFEDDFNRFDEAKWVKGSPSSWSDRYGTIAGWDPGLVSVEGGRLRLRTVQRGGQWYGGLVHGRDKRSFHYGYIEFRAKVPQGQGLWSALWAMPQAQAYGWWPNSGEIDVLEHLGRSSEAGNGYSTVHFHNASGHGQVFVSARHPDFTRDWHTWGCLWEKNGPVRLRFYVDGRLYGTIDQGQWPSAPGGGPGSPFDKAFYLIMNLTVGGAWAQAPVPSVSGKALEVDWVRVWQKR